MCTNILFDHRTLLSFIISPLDAYFISQTFTSVNGAVGTFLQRGASVQKNALCGHTPDPLSALAIGQVPWVTRAMCCSPTAQVTMTGSEGCHGGWPPQRSLAMRLGVASQATERMGPSVSRVGCGLGKWQGLGACPLILPSSLLGSLGQATYPPCLASFLVNEAHMGVVMLEVALVGLLSI